MTQTADKEWLTLRECATDVGVPVEIVRIWCLRHERGMPDGLPSADYSSAPSKENGRKNRRIHIDQWRKFKRSRDNALVRQAKQDVAMDERAPVTASYASRSERRAKVASGRGRSRISVSQ